MDAATAQRIRRLAANRCEYCRLPQQHSALQFHIDHIVSRQHGGKDEFENLALACPECNFLKGPNLTSLDPDTGQITRLFDPRRDRWEDHFVRQDAHIIGRTPVGRTTVWLMQMNIGDRLRWRELLVRLRLLS